MILNTLITTVNGQKAIDKKPNRNYARHKYIMDKYHERSISERYFK